VIRAALGVSFAAASTSSTTIRPPGPEPTKSAKSTFFSPANFLAKGDALTRPSFACAGAMISFLGESTFSSCFFGGTGAASAAGFAGVGAGLLSADALSPASSNDASAAPTCTESPSCTKMSPRTPSSNASISITALSVSTSAMTSPISTVSPGDLCHLTRTPSVMVSLNFGISMVMLIGF
jgi:hypothetical protein